MQRLLVSLLVLSCGRAAPKSPFGAGAPDHKVTAEAPIFSAPDAPTSRPPLGKAIAPGVCASVCADRQLPAAVLRALSTRAKSSRRCYERELTKNANLSFRTTITVRLSASGAPCSAKVLTSDNPEVSDCVIEFFRSPAFPPLDEGDCADVNIPIVFVPST
jgi:hypothetical protein